MGAWLWSKNMRVGNITKQRTECRKAHGLNSKGLGWVDPEQRQMMEDLLMRVCLCLGCQTTSAAPHPPVVFVLFLLLDVLAPQ